MPWKELTVEEERMKFVVAWKSGGWSISDLCREFGISRKTGYKYIQRYKESGLDGLRDQSRAPKIQAFAVNDRIIEVIVNQRKKHPTWGAKKLLASLTVKFPSINNWPSETTVLRILHRNKLVPTKRRYKKPVPVYPFSHVLGPNDVWSADYKGHFTVGNGQRCDPLTVTDAYSRFLLGCRIVSKLDTLNAQKVFIRLFREYGMPLAIRTDNGSPFASNSIAGLSRLSVWWLKLGINLERIEPGKPQQNGRHERMHRTLKQETALPPRSSLEDQQRAFNAFKKEYNNFRPHEALKNKTPSNYYQKSERIYPEKIIEPAYSTNIDVYKVNDLGFINHAEFRVFLSSALVDELIGIEEFSERHARIHFYRSVLGILDLYTGKVLQFKNPKYINVKDL